MGFLDAVSVYFGGEKAAAIGASVLGLGLIGAGLYLWRIVGGGLGAGMGITLLIVGAIAVPAGIGLYVTVDKRVDALGEQASADPAAPVAAEQKRMEKVNKNWPLLKLAWAVLALGALAGLFLVKREAVTGVSLAILFLAACMMIFDVFAEKRALEYTETLEKVTARHFR